MDPRNGGDLLCLQEGVYPVPRRGRREGGAGYGRCPVQVGGCDPQDALRVPRGCDDEEEQGGARALLSEDLPPVGASSTPFTNTVTLPTSRSSSGGCRRWSAASNSDTPPGYVARAWFRYGAVSPGQRVLRACSRAGALLRRDMAHPAPVSRRVSPMDRGRPDRLDSRHSIQCP